MPFPLWDAQFTAVSIFLYETGWYGAWRTPSSGTLLGRRGKGDRHACSGNHHA